MCARETTSDVLYNKTLFFLCVPEPELNFLALPALPSCCTKGLWLFHPPGKSALLEQVFGRCLEGLLLQELPTELLREPSQTHSNSRTHDSTYYNNNKPRYRKRRVLTLTCLLLIH